MFAKTAYDLQNVQQAHSMEERQSASSSSKSGTLFSLQRPIGTVPENELKPKAIRLIWLHFSMEVGIVPEKSLFSTAVVELNENRV